MENKSNKFRSNFDELDNFKDLNESLSSMFDLPSLALERWNKPFTVDPDNLSGPYLRKRRKELKEWREHYNANFVQPMYDEFLKEAEKNGLTI